MSAQRPELSQEEVLAQRKAKAAEKAAKKEASAANKLQGGGEAAGARKQPSKKQPKAKASTSDNNLKQTDAPSSSHKTEAAVAPSSRKETAQSSDGVDKFTKKLQRQRLSDSLSAGDQLRKVALFSHLHQYTRGPPLSPAPGTVHPSFLRLGHWNAEGILNGSSSRCIALLSSFKDLISSYKSPANKELARNLEDSLKPNINFLTQCRPMCVSMGNLIKLLKVNIRDIPVGTSDKEGIALLIDFLDRFYEEKIVLAAEGISVLARQKIVEGDVIMVFGFSSLVCKILIDAWKSGTCFEVIIVDTRPELAGKLNLAKLKGSGIPLTYIHTTALSLCMRHVKKVILGAHALLANGAVQSSCGIAYVAMTARAFNVPVIVCCETYKFCERVQTDSFVFNELCDPNDLVIKGGPLEQWQSIEKLTLLNLAYDVMPSELVSCVITEVGAIPCTAVPAVLRLAAKEVM